MKRRQWGLTFLCTSLLLSACSGHNSLENDILPPNTSIPSPQALGRIEVSFTGVGTQFYSTSVRSLDAGINAQALTDVAQGLQLRFNSKSSFDVGTAGNGTRYLSATYDVRNADQDGTPSSVSRSNLTFVAVDASSPETLSGTAVRNFKLFDGTSADPALAAKIIPSVGMYLNNGVPTVNSTQADFQAFTKSEATNIGLPTGVRDVFQYGYVVRDRVAGRTLAANPAADQYDGLITFAVKLPLQAQAANDPYSFSLVFEVLADSVNRVTRVPEETMAQAQNRAAALGGSLVDGATVCQVRVSGSAASPVTVLRGLGYFEAKPGTLDRCFGPNGTGYAFGNIGFTDVGKDLAIQPDGSIIVAANTSYSGNDYDFALQRYTLDGRLDTTFGTRGSVLTKISSGNDVVSAFKRQADGKFVVIGSTPASDGSTATQFVAVRYNPDGTLDTTFGNGGKVLIAVGGNTMSSDAQALTIQEDGKLLLAGLVHGVSADNAIQGSDLAVVRLNSNGTLDMSFNGTGQLTLPVGPENSTDIGRAVQLQPDGKIIIAGSTRNDASNTNDDMCIVRLLPDGSLDTSFGTGGKIITAAVAGNISDQINSLQIQPDGKFVVAGNVDDRGVGTASDALVARFTVDGILDTSFGNGGISILPIGQGPDTIHALQLQKDGKVVLAGGSNNLTSTTTDTVLVRLTNDGNLDSGFGQQGILRAGASTNTDVANALKIQSDGKIIAVGNAVLGDSISISLIRSW